MRLPDDNKITTQQIELLQSFKYLINENQISEVKELLHLYYTHKLDMAIHKAEAANNYTQEVYADWLSRQRPDTE